MKALIQLLTTAISQWFSKKAVELPKEIPEERETYPDPIWDPSPNFSTRKLGATILGIILHHTGTLSDTSSLSWMKDPISQVSAHYLVTRAGVLYQLVEEKYRAWHAGKSELHGHTDVNSITIGIEMTGDGKVAFTEEQYKVVALLCKRIKEEYQIQDSYIVGHKDVAPGRKTDPSPWDWDKFFSLLNK